MNSSSTHAGAKGWQARPSISLALRAVTMAHSLGASMHANSHSTQCESFGIVEVTCQSSTDIM